MWHTLTFKAYTAAECMDSLIQFVNWMSDTDRQGLMVNYTSSFALKIDFCDDKDLTIDELREQLDEADIFGNCEYRIE